ncbi:MAG: nicotinate phosphoribosyltransferase [Syntrophales bacterium]
MSTSISPLLTDLYQLTMLQSYLSEEMHERAAFEFFIRKLPQRRGFLLASGLDSVLSFLETLRFSEDDLKYIEKTGRFSSKLVDYLADFRFSGDVHAMPEGTVFFENEPVIRVEAPIAEAQLVETRLINLLHFQILIASKAARCVLAAKGRAILVDFGLRRAHGAEAGILAARASYMAGFDGTSTVLAEPLFGIPVFGTMAHSFVEAYNSEKDSFLGFARSNPGNTTLLIDTYDTRNGARIAVDAAKELAKEGIKVRAVRLDSGDLLELAQDTRRILDAGGCKDIQIFASGNIDEDTISDLLSRGAPINGFGVGTKMDTSADAPYLDSAYKLMEYAGRPRFKKSEGKATLPGRKQVFRIYEDGNMVRDKITIEGDRLEGTPLLVKVMEKGRRIPAECDLKKIREFAGAQMKSLPEHLRRLATIPAYPVEISAALSDLQESMEGIFSRR